MLTQQDLDMFIHRGYDTTSLFNAAKETTELSNNQVWQEKHRMRTLMEIVAKVDANDPQKIMELSNNGGLYGVYGYTNVDVATLIFRFATQLNDRNNFDIFLSELKKRGIPDKTFGDAYIIMQKFSQIYPKLYIKKVKEYSNGQYSPELYDMLHKNDTYRPSDPYFEDAVSHFDIDTLTKFDVNMSELLQIDTSIETIRKKFGADAVVKIAGADGKHFAYLNLSDLASLQSKIKQGQMKSVTQKMQTDVTTNIGGGRDDR